jgi:hypothetical protein
LNKVTYEGIGFHFTAEAQQIEHEDDDEHEHDFPLFPALLVGLSCSFACIRIQYQSMRWMLLN